MEILTLRLVHVLGGIFWLGTALFNAFFLFPILSRSGPAAGAVIGGLQQRGLFVTLPVVALLTLLSGLRLMWITSAGFVPAYFASPSGRAYAISGVAAVAAFLVSVLVSRPAAARAAALASAPDRGAEIDRLRRRAAKSGLVATLLLTFAGAGMAIARYL